MKPSNITCPYCGGKAHRKALYKRKYPQGFEVVWLDRDRPAYLAIIRQLGERNRGRAG